MAVTDGAAAVGGVIPAAEAGAATKVAVVDGGGMAGKGKVCDVIGISS